LFIIIKACPLHSSEISLTTTAQHVDVLYIQLQYQLFYFIWLNFYVQMLDENAQLIQAIAENQNKGKAMGCLQ